jgi:hypothetical protein
MDKNIFFAYSTKYFKGWISLLLRNKVRSYLISEVHLYNIWLLFYFEIKLKIIYLFSMLKTFKKLKNFTV